MTAPPATTVAAAQEQARGMGLDRVDRQVLMAHVLGRPRSWLIAHDDASLAPGQWASYLQLCRQRADGMPVAYLVGEREFHGLALKVTPDVLVPRPDTETLVDWALALRPQAPGAARVLDLGTGSGAIALALAHAWRDARVTATDDSAAALAVAACNAGRLGLDIELRRGDWWLALPEDRRFDLVLSNPPYIPAGDPHLVALVHEPALALVAGTDGLDALRRIVAGAAGRLAPGGWLLLEHGWDQAGAVAELLHQAGFSEIAHRHDLAGHWRCTGGRCIGAAATPSR